MTAAGAPRVMSIAVVDDDPLCLAEVEGAVREHMGACGEGCLVRTFLDAPAFLAEAAEREFDIAILDIIMPEKNGMDAALELHGRESTCQIVFLTTSPDYAVMGYRVDAADYILKPVDPLAIGRALDKTRRRARAKTPAFPVILREGNVVRKIDAAEILHCLSEGKFVGFFGDGWSMRCRGRLVDFRPLLPEHFVQTPNRCLVNLERVVGMTPEAMRLDNGEAVPISRAYRESAAKAYFGQVRNEARQ